MSLSSVRPWVARAVCLVALAVSAHYLVWRALHTFNPHALGLSLTLYAAECYGLLMFTLHVLLSWDTRALERRLGIRDGEELADATLPAPAPRTVDVFIPTDDESVALLRNTVLAAREMRMAHRTWVLDDGRRTVMSCVVTRDGHHRVGVRFAPLQQKDERRLLSVLLDSAIGNEPSRPEQHEGVAVPLKTAA